jgi:hypothetical protein
MHRLGIRRFLINNREGPYMFVDYKDENGYQVLDHGSRICIVKDLDEQHWERARRDL